MSIRFGLFIATMFLTMNSFAQMSDYSFGEGFNIKAKDSSFSLRAAFRFQTLFINNWEVRNDDFNYVENHESNFLIRRSRLKFDGFAYSPKLKYKLELGLSNRDINNSSTAYFGNASNVILDAYLDWNFYKGFTLRVGQAKLPGNRERVISSANMQFVDRSRLNSRFNLDRDIGFQLKHSSKVGKQAKVILIAALSQGEGRNMIAGNQGGYEYTFRGEILPFGSFQSKGDYIGSSIKRESKPKLSIGATYDLNQSAVRSRGNLGSFVVAPDNIYKNLQTGFIDMMFKYKGWSVMSEFAIRGTTDNDPREYDVNGNHVGTYFTGSALNVQAGYMFEKNFEFALRYTKVRTQNSVVGKDENQYFLGFSRYLKGHKLKVQSDVGYIQIAGSNDELIWRTQIDIHF